MKSTHDEWTNTVVENERNTTDGHLSLFNTMHADAGWMLLFTIFIVCIMHWTYFDDEEEKEKKELLEQTYKGSSQLRQQRVWYSVRRRQQTW